MEHLPLHELINPIQLQISGMNANCGIFEKRNKKLNFDSTSTVRVVERGNTAFETLSLEKLLIFRICTRSAKYEMKKKYSIFVLVISCHTKVN